MNPSHENKVVQEHLSRGAYLYVRQSTPRQVIENAESTKRQYGLKERALALGWDESQVHVIDCDLGQSGASTERDGFRQLVTEVGLGQAGIVMGLEVSRLARNSTDWHRLVEICALTKTLILDEEGIYDPGHFNDRLLLGLKGTMSEAELYVIRARLQGGLVAKARRGELKMRLPVGFVYDNCNRIVLDPNKRIQESIHAFFRLFRRTGSMTALAREFNQQGLTFPRRTFSGPERGEVVFERLTVTRASQVLHNPRYTGAFVYGVRASRYDPAKGKFVVKYQGREKWEAFIQDAHPGYISWQEYEENLRRLEANISKGVLGRKSPPREGPALLQGLVVCGVCGCRMRIRYFSRRGEFLSPDYNCPGLQERWGKRWCQNVSGQVVDDLIASLLLEKMEPAVLEVALAVQDELQSRIDDADRLRYRSVEQAKYEMDCSQNRYMAVDPHNRLVADELERDWNKAIRQFHEAQEQYEKMRQKDRLVLCEEQRKKVLELCSNFPKLWQSPNTTDRDRKRMVRLLIEDVTLTKVQDLLVQVRYKGGAVSEHRLPLPKNAFEERKHSPEVIAAIDALLEEHTDGEVAEILNARGLSSGTGKNFDSRRISVIRRAYCIKSRYYRLEMQGLLTIHEICKRFSLNRQSVYKLRQSGKIKAVRYDDVGRYLYDASSLDNTMARGDVV